MFNKFITVIVWLLKCEGDFGLIFKPFPILNESDFGSCFYSKNFTSAFEFSLNSKLWVQTVTRLTTYKSGAGTRNASLFPMIIPFLSLL